jgi:CheY-like chemotaxis protein/LmbE family N-acetylglucosaminyl deacetylase
MAQDRAPEDFARILLVEDDLDQAHLVRFLLENEGPYQVTLAQDGLRGTALVQEREWALIITDLNLPGVDGLAVVEAARTHRPGTPVMATTGYSGPEYAEKARAQGAHDVLLKPLDRDDLLARVRALLAGPLPDTAAQAPPAAPSDPGKSPSGEPVPHPGTPSSPPASPPSPTPAHRPRPDAGPPPVLGPAPGVDPKRVLAISIRPGDAEAGCGGTLLRHRVAGDQVVLLTLTHGAPDPNGAERAEAAKQAGRRMGVRFFVGNAGTGEDSLAKDLQRLVSGAIREIGPHLIYVPTHFHADPAFRTVHDTALERGKEAESILAYDPGDAEPGFAPELFIPVDGVLDAKTRVVEVFDSSHASHLSPDHVLTSSRFWARHTGGRPAEPLARIRGGGSLFSDPPEAR